MSKDGDDLANQAIDIIFENDALQTRIIEPIKRRFLPYLLCIGFFNLTLFLLVAYIAARMFKHST